MTVDPWQLHPDRHCIGKTSLMYPGKNAGEAGVQRAIAICQGCPVQAECFLYAKANHEPAGIWGGASFTRRGRSLQPIDHGTSRGYKQHMRQGVPFCPECTAANTVGQYRRRLQRRLKVSAA